MLGAAAVILGLYALFWYSGGPDFGARYWYLIIFPLVYLSVRGVQILAARGRPTHGQAVEVRLFLALAALCVLSVINYLPWRALDKYYHFLNMQPDILRLAQEYRFGKSLVLIQGESHPDYASAWIYNPLDPVLDAPLYAFDQDAEVRTRLLQSYADRTVWIVAGPSLTGDTYRPVAGPLAAEQVDANFR